MVSDRDYLVEYLVTLNVKDNEITALRNEIARLREALEDIAQDGWRYDTAKARAILDERRGGQ